MTRRGFSLPEVLVSTFFLTLFSVMLYQFNRAVLRSVRLQEVRGEAQEVARIAIDVMTRELRLSGYGGAGVPLPRLRAAGPERVEVQADLNGDGDTGDANEIVTYAYDLERETLMRATGTAPPQPMVEHVPEGNFLLRYRDDSNVLLEGELDEATRARVRQIEIGLRVVYPNPDPAPAAPIVVTQHATVELRNATP